MLLLGGHYHCVKVSSDSETVRGMGLWEFSGSLRELMLKYNHINGFVGVLIGTASQWSKQEACFACVTWVWLAVNHTTPVSLLANEFDVRSVMHMQVSLTAVNQIYVIHKAMNGCKNLKIH